MGESDGGSKEWVRGGGEWERGTEDVRGGGCRK